MQFAVTATSAQKARRVAKPLVLPEPLTANCELSQYGKNFCNGKAGRR